MSRILAGLPPAVQTPLDQDSEQAARLFGQLQDLRAKTHLRTGGASLDRLDITLSRIYLEAIGRTEAVETGEAVTTEHNLDQVTSVLPSSVESPLEITGEVVRSASRGELQLLGSAGTVVADATLVLTGSAGSQEFDLSAGESLEAVRDRINSRRSETGVFAQVEDDGLSLYTQGFGTDATVRVQLTASNETQKVTSNNSQVTDVQIVTAPTNSPHTLSGTIDQTAQRGQLIYQGGAGGVVTDTATFSLQGTNGSAIISITKDESLADVADRIAATSLGVTAVISGDNLILETVDVGSNSTVAVELTSITQEVAVSGVNPSQVDSFSVNAVPEAGVHPVAGNVTHASAEAELTYTGFLGGATNSATFTLTGNQGSAEISVVALESLASVRDKINQESATTGVTAAVSGNELVLTSQSVGTAATVSVVVTAGSFSVSGGNGDGTANGVDAQAVINGQNLTAAGDTFSISDGQGAYELSVVSGYVGALDSISVSVTDGTFVVTGGDGNGTAAGTDATATINGTSLVGDGSTFTVNDGGEFRVTFSDDFVGTFDDIVIAVEQPLAVTGGDDQGSATGTNGVAIINGVSLESESSVFVVPVASGQVQLEFAESFVGSFDPVQITPVTDSASDLFSLQSQLFRDLGPKHFSRSNFRQVTQLVHASFTLAQQAPAALTSILSSDDYLHLYNRSRISELLGQ